MVIDFQDRYDAVSQHTVGSSISPSSDFQTTDYRCGFLTNKFCEFLFKSNTGTLYTNAMISNFVVDQDPACS